MTTQLIFFILIYLTIFALLPEYLSRRETHREPKTEIEDEATRLARQDLEEIEYLAGLIEMPAHMRPAPKEPRLFEAYLAQQMSKPITEMDSDVRRMMPMVSHAEPRKLTVCQTCIAMSARRWKHGETLVPDFPICEVKNALGETLYHYHEHPEETLAFPPLGSIELQS